jgi:20S proteasome subunit beta 3
MDYNGAAIIGMAGKNCVGIAADRRLGLQLSTIACDFTKVFPMHSKLMVGLAGLATDVQTVKSVLEFRLALYKLREERDMSPTTFRNMMSTLLYEKRFGPYYIEPIIAGLDDKNQPFLSTMDLIGAVADNETNFVVAGTCTGNMYGMCESLYRPDMNEDELFETLSQSLLSSVDRDAMSGWGGIVYIITPEGTTIKELKGRMD